MTQSHGTILWSELMTRDVDAARSFYENICGWQYATMPNPDGGDYHVASVGERPVAGIMDMATLPQLADLPPHWFTYIGVDDVDAASEQVQALGGTVERAPFDIPGVGRIAIISDPGGAVLGIMTPTPQG